MVFGLFKKKPDKGAWAREVISGIIQLQLTLTNSSAASITDDLWALGYIFGFHDGFLLSIQIDDQSDRIAIVSMNYKYLFGDAKLVGKSISLQQDEIFTKGAFEGGNQALAYLQDGTNPMGLARHLRDRNKKQ